MPRTNACSELTRFWLEVRHGCCTLESVPVPVPYASSDIDLVALRPDQNPVHLPDGTAIGLHIIVETKDEHDWEPSGREFAAYLKADIEKMAPEGYIPARTKGVKFTMLREEHYRKAEELFAGQPFDRLFVVHALDPQIRSEVCPRLTEHRIYWLTVPELVKDLVAWYKVHPRPATLRHSPVGDLLHLLIGFCHFEPREQQTT